jgi:tetratricopeptide (TPR) repeat protein
MDIQNRIQAEELTVMKPGRNDSCPCGSGKKYKRCCGQAAAAAPKARRHDSPATLNPQIVAEFADLVQQGRWSELERKAGALLNVRQDIGMLWKIFSVALVRQGKEALMPLGRAAELLPNDPEAQCNLGGRLRALGRWQESLLCFQRALKAVPDHLEAQIQAADILSGSGRPREAVTLYERALLQSPRAAEVHNNLGNALFQLGQFEEAISRYRSALATNPNVARLHSNLANALRKLGRLDEAARSGRRAVELDPKLAEAHNVLGLVLAAQGEFEEALSCYRSALSLEPNHVDAMNNLGNALRDVGERRESLAYYSRAIELDPSHAESHCNLGNALLDMQRNAEAAMSYAAALRLKPDYAVAHLSLSMAQRMLGQADEALQSCEAALAIDPNYAEALALLGELKADRGQFADAQALFQKAISLDPGFPFAYFNVAMHRKMTSDDAAWFGSVEALLRKPMPLRHEISLRYALGKYHDDVKQFEQAFDQYRQANELTKRNGLLYDAAKLTLHVDQIIADFSAVSIREAQKFGHDSQVPVFIVGMPRSGTSLTEQILASHPSVFGAGEIVYWDGAYDSFRQATLKGAVAADLIPAIATEYLDRLAKLSGRALRVVDKMPPNFMNLGLIHAALPHAKIIHMRRHPIDTCLSIYFQYFLNTHPYANDLDNLLHYYREYFRIMDHWRRTLPAEALLEIPYESLTANQELWSRRLVDFAGLPWDPKCLEFHQTDRVVITASKWQVRQKIHTASAGRWRNYERFVAPLMPLAGLAANASEV